MLGTGCFQIAQRVNGAEYRLQRREVETFIIISQEAERWERREQQGRTGRSEK